RSVLRPGTAPPRPRSSGMSVGRVYSWIPDPRRAAGGRAARAVVPLERLETAGPGARLGGRFVEVRNAGAVYEPEPAGGEPREVSLGDALPDADGNFLFEPGRGGGRIEKVPCAPPDFTWRYVQAARFGEVNAYHHIDRVAAYVDSLLKDVGAGALPVVRVLVNAHHAVTECDGVRDGVRRLRRWVPFQGGHYRLSRAGGSRNAPPPVSSAEG